MIKIKHKLDVLKDVLKYDVALLKNFGLYIASLHFIMKVIFRGSKTSVGKKMYRKMYTYCEKRMAKEYAPLIEKFRNRTMDKSFCLAKDSPIWVFWWQGIDAAPDIVRFCINSVEQYAGRHKVVVITKDNFTHYTDIPKHVIDKVNDGIITLTHFSDHLRVDLLSRNGGIWIDATLWMTGDIPEEVYSYSMYTIKHGRYADYHVCRGLWSSFFLCSVPGNPLMEFCHEFLSEYWMRENLLICYLLVDVLLCIAYDNFTWAREMMDAVPLNNTDVFEMQDHMNCIYDKEQMNIWNERTMANKLSYKIPFDEYKNNKMSYWGYLKQLVEEFKGNEK